MSTGIAEFIKQVESSLEGKELASEDIIYITYPSQPHIDSIEKLKDICHPASMWLYNGEFSISIHWNGSKVEMLTE